MTGGRQGRLGDGSDPGTWVVLAPAHRQSVEIRQGLRIQHDKLFELRSCARAEVRCWGEMPSEMLRHPLFVRWLDGWSCTVGVQPHPATRA